MSEDLQNLSDSHPKALSLVIARAQHILSRKMIDEEPLKVLYRLYHHGFMAYLVGGSVRDLLLGRVPKDFDVATNAHPHEVTGLFRNSRIIGRRFRLVHVFFKGRKIVEVSTFRSRSEYEEKQTENGEIIRTDSFGTPEEDALRRDITINGLFYNIGDFSIIDHVGGMTDLEKGIIRTIGDPDERYQQDPVRMIRVIRHAGRTGFSIEDQTYQAIIQRRDEIKKCSSSRVRDEFLRDLREGTARSSLDLMLRTGLLFSIFPDLDRALGNRNPFKIREIQFFLSSFRLVDQLVGMNKEFPESIHVALLLSPLIRSIMPDHLFLGEKERNSYHAQTVRFIVHQVLSPYTFPGNMKEGASQILIAQSGLRKLVNRGSIPKRLRGKKHFQDAVLFFGIEAEARGERVPSLLQTAVPVDLLPWWPQRIRRRRRRFRKPQTPDSKL